MVRLASAAPPASPLPSAPGVVYTTTTPTPCPVATPELFLVEPVTSPTTSRVQTVTVRLGNGEAVTVSAESGVFTTTGSFGAFANPALVNVSLLTDATHHLHITGTVRLIYQGGCPYGGYSLSTMTDRNRKPLVIVQVSERAYLPVIAHDLTRASPRSR